MAKRRIVLVAGIVLLAAILCGLLMSYFVFQIPLFDASGWRSTPDGKKQYLNYFGRPTVGWTTVDGQKYYFDRDAVMHTGWLDTENGSYYLSETGVMQTGWLETAEGTYYFQPDGIAQFGWLELTAGKYYFTSDHKMYTGWLKSGEDHYYFGADGVMRTGWLETETGRYFLHEDGARHVSWLEHEDGRYFFNVDGTMRTGWLSSRDGKFYLTDSGKAHIGWLTLPEGRYYMDEKGCAVTGFVTLDGTSRYFRADGLYIPLVNPKNPMTTDYQLQLITVEKYQVDATCAQALKDLLAACRKAGNKVQINSAYRDEKKQQSIWEDYRKNYMSQGYTYDEAEKMTAGYVAVPGTSEHHTGLGIDLGSGSKTYKWLAQNCWDYGFILRYPEDKTHITGFNYEPWHFRYVGKEMAKAIQASGLTLEEYLDTLK